MPWIASARGGAGANGHGLVDAVTRSDEYLDTLLKRDGGGDPGVTVIDAAGIRVAARRAGDAAECIKWPAGLRKRRFR